MESRGKNQVFLHHIYEYQKGLRNLILHTTAEKEKNYISKRLEAEGIAYLICRIKTNINVFFGDSACIEVVRSFGCKSLCDYTPEQDFILGIMLGYDRLKQCSRYLNQQNIIQTSEKSCRKNIDMKTKIS